MQSSPTQVMAEVQELALIIGNGSTSYLGASTPAALLVKNCPPAPRSEANRLKSVLVVAIKAVVLVAIRGGCPVGMLAHLKAFFLVRRSIGVGCQTNCYGENAKITAYGFHGPVPSNTSQLYERPAGRSHSVLTDV